MAGIEIDSHLARPVQTDRLHRGGRIAGRIGGEARQADSLESHLWVNGRDGGHGQRRGDGLIRVGSQDQPRTAPISQMMVPLKDR